jgi:hypothetical protein
MLTIVYLSTTATQNATAEDYETLIINRRHDLYEVLEIVR